MLNYDAKITPDPVLGKGHYLVHVTVSAPKLSENECLASIVTINYLIDISKKMINNLNIVRLAVVNSINNLASGWRFKVITFNEKSQVLIEEQTKPKDPNELRKALGPIDSLKNYSTASGNTNIISAFGAEAGIRVLLTGGHDYKSSVYDVIHKIKNTGTGTVEEIYTIGIGEKYNKQLLDDLADKTGTQHSWPIRDEDEVENIIKEVQKKFGRRTKPVTVMAIINNNTSAHSIGTLDYEQHGVSFIIPVQLPVDDKEVKLTLIDNFFSNKTIILDLENAEINEGILADYVYPQMEIINDITGFTPKTKGYLIICNILPYVINNKSPQAQEVLKKIPNNVLELAKTSAFNKMSSLTDKGLSKNSLPSSSSTQFSTMNSGLNPEYSRLKQLFSNPNPLPTSEMDYSRSLFGADPVLLVSNFDSESKPLEFIYGDNPLKKSTFAQTLYLMIRPIENYAKIVEERWKVDYEMIFIIENIGYLCHPRSDTLRNPCVATRKIFQDPSKDLDTKLNTLLTFTTSLFPGNNIDSVYKTYSSDVASVLYDNKIVPCISINRFIHAKVGTDSIKAFFIMHSLSQVISFTSYLPKEYEVYWYPSWVILKTNESIYLIGSTKIYNLSSPETLKQASQHYTTLPSSEQIFKECLARFKLDLMEESTSTQQEIFTSNKNENNQFEEQKTNMEEIADNGLDVIEKSTLTQQGIFANTKNKSDPIEEQKTSIEEITADSGFEILQIDSFNKGKKPS